MDNNILSKIKPNKNILILIEVQKEYSQGHAFYNIRPVLNLGALNELLKQNLTYLQSWLSMERPYANEKRSNVAQQTA